jgi:hypothetical protein
MHLNKNNEDLVLYNSLVGWLNISLSKNNVDDYNELINRYQEFIDRGYIKEPHTMTKAGLDLLDDIYLEYRDRFKDFLLEKHKKFKYQDASKFLGITEIQNIDAWINYFLNKLKSENFITDFNDNRNDEEIKCYFD